MKYEIYSEQEVSTTTDDDIERIALLAEIGLAQKTREQESASRFREIYEDERIVFGMLFPNQVGIKEYNGFIPTRVLQEIRDYKNAFPDHTVSIMCPKPGDTDPVVIGNQYSFQRYNGCKLIARFGDALEDFSTLRNRAYERIAERIRDVKTIPGSILIQIVNGITNA
jgi:hypothetical protein